MTEYDGTDWQSDELQVIPTDSHVVNVQEVILLGKTQATMTLNYGIQSFCMTLTPSRNRDSIPVQQDFQSSMISQ